MQSAQFSVIKSHFVIKKANTAIQPLLSQVLRVMKVHLGAVSEGVVFGIDFSTLGYCDFFVLMCTSSLIQLDDILPEFELLPNF